MKGRIDDFLHVYVLEVEHVALIQYQAGQAAQGRLLKGPLFPVLFADLVNLGQLFESAGLLERAVFPSSPLQLAACRQHYFYLC